MEQHRWNNPVEWLQEKIPKMNKAQLKESMDAITARLDPDTIRDLFQGEMDKDGYFRARWGPGCRAKRHTFLDKKRMTTHTAWYAEVQLDGKWHCIVDEADTTPSGLIEGKTAHEARKKAKEYLDARLAAEEGTKK